MNKNIQTTTSLTITDGGSGALCESQMRGGSDVWYHHSDTGIPSILTEGFGKCQRRVKFGRDGMELEANVCIGRV